MHLVNLTTARIKRLVVPITALFIYSTSIAQENSPYSRYGIGDMAPAGNILNRSMGGISAGYVGSISTIIPDIRMERVQSLNFLNPASLGYISRAVFDVGGEVDRRTLKSNNSPQKYTATNTTISYLQLGMPIASKKMEAKGTYWGLSFGIRPISRINYKIEENKRTPGIDSINTLFEGSGGMNQASISTGLKIKRFSFGLTSGYNFGSKDYSTRVSPINDSVIYYKSNTETKASFGGVFLSGGIQYEFKTKNGILSVGAYGTLEQKLKASRSVIGETFAYDGNGGTVTIDTVSFKPDEKGTIVYPATYAIGFTYMNKNWLFGADFETQNWNNYRFYGEKDALQNTWKVKAGVQYYPLSSSIGARKYLNLIKYRAGAYFGPDLALVNNTNRSEIGVTFGAGLPLTRNDFANLNAGFEVASRGNKQSQSVRESIMRFTFGVSMNARWFQKRKYD
jgi:hypothetical protein